MKLFKFYKENCYPCSTLSAILRRLELPENIELIEVNASLAENKELVEQYNIEKVPVLVFEDDSKRLIGVKPKIIVEQFLKGEN
jgi:thiol-disulfide isomerase/thioredoxin